MNYKAHFLEQDIPLAEKEVSHIIDLCGLIAINVHEGKIQQANRMKHDLINSLESVVKMNESKVTEDKIRLIINQIQGEQQQKELIRRLMTFENL